MQNATSVYIADFWKEHYLDTYIADGGSKIKFITGASGTGKTRMLDSVLASARDSGYVVARASAKKTWLHDFKEIYLTIFDAVDFDACLRVCADKIIENLGYRPDDVPTGMTFADYLLQIGDFDPITKREIRSNLSESFFSNTWIDNNFAISSALMTSGILGYPALEPTAKELLLQWHRGQKEARVAALRKLGLSPSRITKHNARHMLRSLIEIVRLAGYKGLVVGIDDLDALSATSALEEIRYTKMRREDAYESIRELIDNIDTLAHFMTVFAFDRDLIEDEVKGIKSYQALWMRIQNEIGGERVNKFADIIYLNEADRLDTRGEGNDHV